MMRSLITLSLALASPSNPQINPPWQFAVSLPAPTVTGIDPSANPEIVQVDCDKGMGTAFKIGPRLLISVAHVTGMTGCKIAGSPINVIRSEGDFSILRSDTVADRWLTIDCGGFKRGHLYEGRGYARGLPTLTSVDVTDTGQSLGGFEKLWGVFTVVPGQSGGALIDLDTNKVVGTINVFDAVRGLSGSVSLSTTSVCGNA
jgi:hypothetical protein